MKMELLLPHQVDEVLAKCPIAILPWGALEWHGHHLAVGQDALKVSALADEIAAKLGCVSLPPVYVGHGTMKLHAGFKKTLEFRLPTVEALLTEYLEQLEDEGFKVCIVLAGHYGSIHMGGLRHVEAAYTQERKHKMKVQVLTDYDLVKDLGYQGDHAGKWESSIFWHYYPDHVDMGRFKQGVPLREQGVGGENPYETASRELGREIARAIVDRTAQRALELLEEDKREE